MKEKRSCRINLSLTHAQYNNLCKMARIANLKPIQYATYAVINKRIFTQKNQFLMSLLLKDYRQQVGFSKLVLRDCDITSEVERIANNTISDFVEKIEKLEQILREEDGYRHNNQED